MTTIQDVILLFEGLALTTLLFVEFFFFRLGALRCKLLPQQPPGGGKSQPHPSSIKDRVYSCFLTPY